MVIESMKIDSLYSGDLSDREVSEEGPEKNSIDLRNFSPSSGIFPTYFIFTDLPKHIEFRTENLPILREGMEVDFDLNIKNPRDPKKTKRIEGTHRASRIVLKYGGKRSGFTQYVEWKII
jgi:hypothetical protein